jgi:hypothetical protein
MAMLVHAAADHRAIQHVQGGEQRGGAVALAVVCHGSALTQFQRQSWLSAVECLDLRFLVDGRDHRMGGRIHVDAVTSSTSAAKAGSVERLKVRMRCGWSRCTSRMRWIMRRLRPTALAIARLVQCVAAPGGSAQVRAITRYPVASDCPGTRRIVPGLNDALPGSCR